MATRRAVELKGKFCIKSADDFETLAFKDLKVGSKFIALPLPGDNNGHGGFLGAYFIFEKVAMHGSKNAMRVSDGMPHTMTDGFPVICVK